MWMMNFRLYFFFTQKTAYEMRISDWSSDVCSSDLEARPHRAHLEADHAGTDDDHLAWHLVQGERAGRGDHLLFVGLDTRQRRRLRAGGDEDALGLERLLAAGLQLHRHLAGGRDQIGRASCRERVCQYV